MGVKTFRHFDEVLADPAVDLVVLATPNDLHAPHAIQALAAGKHVVTDKPMCLSMAEADQMIAASQAHDRLLSVFQNRRWDGDFLAVKDALAQGLVGDYGKETSFEVRTFDAEVEIPMYGYKNSLNVAAASAVLVFEVLRQWQAVSPTCQPTAHA